MVFEAVVVELLNKFLKQYIENLDSSQLKIGIWGGDVVLKNLKIKATILEDLNLPVRVKWGRLGKLVMKIPWKNLYSSQVVIEVEELLLIFIPNCEFKYDAVKEEKWANDKKQARLRKIDEAKKRDSQQDPVKHDGFLEKLMTQITKNLQVVIKNIHIRYEDKTTIPGSPFSVGLTLANLSALTTLSDPTSSFSKMMEENENFICKLVKLECLSIYWNSSSVLFSELSEYDLIEVMLASIPQLEYKPDGFTYMFGPLSASAFLRLNPKPEIDGSNYSIPKVFLNVHLKEIELAVTHNQFCEAMSYLQDFHRFLAANKYRKYRPVGIPVLGHAKEWWHFAYVGVLEDILRRKKEWSWDHIKNHRQTCRKYALLFKTKLQGKKLTAEDTRELAELEKQLNVFNLVLIREQVYMEVERQLKEAKPGGWFSGWFGYGSDARPDSSDGELVKKIQSVMTPQEKQKLYKAIGYEESATPTNYPPFFVKILFWFHLDEIKMTVYDDRTNHLVSIMTGSVKSVRMEFEQREGFAMKLVITVGNFGVKGKQNEDKTFPELVTSNCAESESLIDFLYEKKPLNAPCDQRIIADARPLRIIYHAATINLIREVFSSDTEEVEKIVAATSASLPTFQKITTLGLQYAIEKRTELEVKVNIMSSYLIIPYGGIYHPNKEMLVLLLGKLSVETEESDKKNVNVKQLFLEGTTDEEIFSTVLSASYTNFKCNLTGVQVLFQLRGEDWVAASTKQRSSLQFLEPTNLEVIVKKSLVLDDARIPKMIIEGKMPSLAFNFQEERFLSLVALASSIPTSIEKNVPLAKKRMSSSVWSLQSIGNQLDGKLVYKPQEFTVNRIAEYTQGIDLVVHFEMNELLVTVSKTRATKEDGKSRSPDVAEKKFLNLRIMKLEMDFTGKTFEAINLFKLGGLEFKQYHNKDWLPFVSTKLGHDYLFVVEYISLNTKIPDFYTAKGGIVKRLTLSITPLNILLEKEALLAQIEFITNVHRKMESVKMNHHGNYRMADAGKGKESYTFSMDSGQFEKKVITKGKRFRRKHVQKEVIDFFMQASLDEIDVVVEFKSQGVAEFQLKGGSIDMSRQQSYTTFDLNLREILLMDLSPVTKHSKIISSLEKQTLASRVTLYNKEFFGSEELDMAVEAEVGGIQCIFVALFFSRAIEYLSAFQSQIETLKEGVTIAAEKAKENVVKAFHNAAEICLKIKMAAPILLIPASSVAMEVLAIDLGVLTIRNSITELDYTQSHGLEKRPLIDTLKVHLQNLKMSRCIINENTGALSSEKIFLVPVSFDLNVKRNLSAVWFKLIPEVEIIARLTSIQVDLTHEDLVSILNTFRDNLREGSPHETLRERHEIFKKPVQHAPSKVKEFKAISAINVHSSDHEFLGDSSQFYTVVKFMFYMDSFIFNALLNREDKTTNEVGLARFVLEDMSVKGRVFSNNTMHMALTLVSCILDDMRPGKEDRLTRLMQRTVDMVAVEEEGSISNSMVEVIFHKKDIDIFVDIRVYKFTLILSMDFLQKLSVFFTLQDLPSENLKNPVKSIDKPNLELEKDASRPTSTVNLRLEKPDIIFVENMDSVNTDALIFHTEMVMKIRAADTRLVVSGTLKDIELYSCCFNPVKRPHTMNQVIKPFTISLAGSTPEGSGLHVDICVTDIFICINPGTVDLISKCCEALLRDASSGQEDDTEKSYKDLWHVKQFHVDDYWFLKPELGIDALSIRSSLSSIDWEAGMFDQICLLAVPSINILLEGVPTSRVQPLVLIEMGFQMRCCNWSQRLSMMNSLTLEMKYFNDINNSWEPMIEPVEKFTKEGEKCAYTPWELNCSVTYAEEGELDVMRPPKVQITLSCTDMLQLTLTRTGFHVLKTALEKYTTAVTKHLVTTVAELPPYVVKNETGLVIDLLLEESRLQVLRSLPNQYNIVSLDANSEVELKNAELASAQLSRNVSLSVIKRDARLHVKIPEVVDRTFELPLGKQSKICHMFNYDESNVWALVSEVSIVQNSTTVLFRSIFTIINYFNEPINVHSLSKDGTVAEYIGVVEGNSSYNLPLRAVYSGNKNLFFSVNGYSLSDEPFNWELIKEDASSLLQCTSKMPENQDPFFIQAIGESELILHEKTLRKSPECTVYKLHLQPTVKIFNSLPFPLVVCFQGSAEEKDLQPGNYLQITNAEPGASTVALRITDYLEKEWSCKERILVNPAEFFVWKFISYNGLAPESLNLGVHVTYKRKTVVYTIYCPYLMVNKTGYLLSYKFEGSSTVFFHPGNLKVPVMFSPSSKKFYSKKSASIQVNQSRWSDIFPVDVAGSGGIVECKCSLSEGVYKISVSISLTYNSLTKIVVFTPYYVLINSAEYDMECRESDRTDWLKIPSQSYTPFWPQSHAKESTLLVRPVGSDEVSVPFAYHSTDECLLGLNNEYGGIYVTVRASQSGSYITFTSYEAGQAPGLILNHSPVTLTVHEVNTHFSVTLEPMEQVLHTWVCPTGDRKVYIPGAKNSKTVIALNEDDDGLIITENDVRIRYFSFLEGSQRMLLFTKDVAVSRSLSSIKLTGSGVELICKIQGIGLSLVNDINRVDILYLTFVSSGISWQTKRFGKKFYKQLEQEDALHLEEAYQKYLDKMEAGGDAVAVVSINDKIKVDFEKMQQLEPAPRELRRTFEPGFWLAYRQIEDQIMVHMKINRIQMDNQLLECVFPVVLAPVPPPKTVAYQGPKPFFELSVLKRITEKSGIEQFKYFKTLVQEFHVKMDVAFIQQLYTFIAEDEISEEQEKWHFKNDMEFIEKPLQAHIEVVAGNELKHFYDLLHFSPLKIHFSFSLAGKLESKKNLPPALGVMIQSLGVTLTDIHDVIFRLSFFEKKGVFLTNHELKKQIVSHYYGQIVRQTYVLVLGLDVIGNPFGLIVGIGEGVEAVFYEPFQGIIQGPSEFGKGMAIGWKKMFSSTVGSAAGTLGKLTGSLGKGLAVLSLDKEYQMQRMMEQGQNDNIQASMARGGRGMVMGVWEGVTGIVQKPIKGAQEEGVGGFFKGMGKGMMGLVTRPVTGIVDFASTSLNAVKRATVIGADNSRMRPPRFMRADQPMEPYCSKDAEGNLILSLICKRKYCTNDTYEFHTPLKENEVVVLTNKRIILAEYNEVFGTWQEHMAITWHSMPERPRCHTKGVAITMPMKAGATKKDVKVLLIENVEVREIVCKKMIELYTLDVEERKQSQTPDAVV